MDTFSDVIHEDEAFLRLLTLKRKCAPADVMSVRLANFTALLEQAFQNSLLPISDEEKAETISILRGYDPIVWQLLEENAGELVSGEYQEPDEHVDSQELFLKKVGKESTTSNGNFMGLKYKDFLKFCIWKMESGVIKADYYKALEPYRWGKSLDKKYKKHQPFVSQTYARDPLIITGILGAILLFFLVIIGLAIYQTSFN